MNTTLSEYDLSIIFAETKKAAARLRRRLGPAGPDLEDLRQDLLLDLLRRLPAFDPSRATLGAFCGLVLRNRASGIAARVAAERRGWNGPLLSLDAPGADGETLVDLLVEDDGLSGWHGNRALDHMIVETHGHVAQVLDSLTPRERGFCAAATEFPIQTLADNGFGSRATLYRHLHDLRCVLTASGLRTA